MPRLDSFWYSINPVSLLLAPLSWVFGAVARLRRLLYRLGLKRSRRFGVPVIIVGNITVGGTGKTPLVIWLAGHLRELGWQPGIVSRGYGGKAQHWPQQVRADSDPAMVGDEAVMLASRTGCPMCVGPDRPAAVDALLAHTPADIIISDDGLQHYALRRDIEIAVIDGERRLGNGLMLPAGPLREPASRLRSVDLVIANGQGAYGEFSMNMVQPSVRHLQDGSLRPIEDFADQHVHAIAGIGNPQRFFDLLRRYRICVNEHAFPDHHVFRPQDVVLEPKMPVLMTEKDAVKCRRLPCQSCWVVLIDAQPDAPFIRRLDAALTEFSNG